MDRADCPRKECGAASTLQRFRRIPPPRFLDHSKVVDNRRRILSSAPRESDPPSRTEVPLGGTIIGCLTNLIRWIPLRPESSSGIGNAKEAPARRLSTQTGVRTCLAVPKRDTFRTNGEESTKNGR